MTYQSFNPATGKLRPLARCIFGGNQGAQKIATTAPVTQEPKGEEIAMTAPVTQIATGGARLVRFIMPSRYALEQLPVPNDTSVHPKALPPERSAVARFSGLAREAKVAAETARLLAFVEARRLVARGPVSLARYDPPWTFWFLRRNEVMVHLASAS